MSAVDESKQSARRVSNLSAQPPANSTLENLKEPPQSELGKKSGESPQTATERFMNEKVEKNHASKYSKDNYNESQAPAKSSAMTHNKEHEGGFAAVLGLPTITVETLY